MWHMSRGKLGKYIGVKRLEETEMGTKETRDDGREMRLSPPPGRALRGEPLFGFALFLTPVLALAVAAQFGAAVGGLLVTVMLLPLLAIRLSDHLPALIYGLFDRNRRE